MSTQQATSPGSSRGTGPANQPPAGNGDRTAWVALVRIVEELRVGLIAAVARAALDPGSVELVT